MSETKPPESETKPKSHDTVEAAAIDTPAAGETTASTSEPAGLDLQAIADQHPMSEADDPDIDVSYRTRHLERNMTDEERLKVGAEMAENLEEAEVLERKKKAIDDDLKDQIGMHYEQAATLAKALRKGTREGPVEVKVRKNWHTGSITVMRPDTGEILEERAMTFDERQRTLLDGSTATEAVTDPSVGHDALDEPQETLDHRQTPVEALAMTAGKAGYA